MFYHLCDGTIVALESIREYQYQRNTNVDARMRSNLPWINCIVNGKCRISVTIITIATILSAAICAADNR